MIENLQGLIGHAGVMQLKNGKTANFGGIRVEGENFVYYTGKGLREMWPQNPNEKLSEETLKLRAMSEAELIASDHIHITPISQIEAILS